MKEKFTKGPWQYTPAGPADSEGMGICAMWGESEELTANAHLIAADPDMYAMLQKIADRTVHDFNYATAKPIYDLLAKARGEQDD